MSKIQTKIPDWVNYAWLGLGDISKLEIDNPLIRRTPEDIANPGLHELRLMRNPEYIAFAAKTLLDIQLLPEQSAILHELWTHAFPMYVGSRGFGKSFLLAVYATLRCILYPATKIVVVGAGFRQAKVIFEYMQTIWNNAPILRSICDNDSGPRIAVDRCIMKFNDSWTIAIPLGDGSKIRGLRAHIIIGDEFASIPLDIYETVVAGFAAVSASPITNVQEASRRKELAKLGLWTADAELKYGQKQRNQAIISGTADYGFKPFAQYWRRYKAIIESRNNKKLLQEILNSDDDIPEGFDARDYTVIRIPQELVPEGFMDNKQIVRAKATIHSGIYAMEYGAVFVDDSEGFFKRSLIESCVASDIKPILLPSGPVWFDSILHGKGDKEYILGIDPASESDNFTILILELYDNHSRIVYGWSTNRKDFKKRLSAGLTTKDDFYGFCARKIRELMKAFNIIGIAMDGQGGGVAVEEALHDSDKMEPGELPIWPIIEDDKEKDTDGKSGLHILHICQFARAEWTSAANHGLRKDMEDKAVLFPRFDTVTLGLAADSDGIRKQLFEKENPNKTYNIYDTVEDCVMEIEELKNELSTIVMTQTSAGPNARDRWDTPEVKLPNGKKGKLRKDRYSALVMANMVARSIKRADVPPEYNMIGDFASNIVVGNQANEGSKYSGPEWFTKNIDDFFSVL